MSDRMVVVVPVRGSQFERDVLPGSGIVARPTVATSHVVGNPTASWVLVDYEGNKYGAVDLGTWTQRVFHAWGRASQNYPTVARQAVPTTQVVVVGDVDEDGEVTVWNQHRVDEWLTADSDQPWATRFDETWTRHGLQVPQTRSHLVVVWAGSAEAAQSKSGLVMEAFHPASDAELDEWQDTLDVPLDMHELGVLTGLVRRKLRAVSRSRQRGPSIIPSAHDANRTQARRLTTVAAKLEALADEAVETAERLAS